MIQGVEKGSMDDLDVESKEGGPEPPRSPKRELLSHLFDPLKVPTVINVVDIRASSPRTTTPSDALAGALARDMELGEARSAGSSVVSSFDMSSLTHTDFRGDLDAFGLNHRLGSATNTKLLAMERAHLLDLSLAMEREEDSGSQFPIYSFTLITIASSFLIFLPLLWVPRDVQRATFLDSPLSTAMDSIEFYNAVYFLIGSCSCLAFESVMSIILFYFYQKSIQDRNRASPARSSVLLGPRVIVTMCLVSFSTICIVVVPYLFVLRYRGATLVDEATFVSMTTWQYEMAETVAICYTLSNIKLSNHFGVCGFSDKVLIESTLIASWILNLVSRVLCTDSNLGGIPMFPAVLPSVGAALGYFLALFGYIYLVLRDGLVKKTGKEKYRATANFLVLGVTVIYMAYKFMWRESLDYQMADTTTPVLVSRTFVLNILIVPMSFLLPARVMQVDHFFVRNALATLTTNLQKLQEKDKEAQSAED